MSETPVRRQLSAQRMQAAIEEALREHGGLDAGELVVHFDLVAETRRIDADGEEHTRRRRWSAVGADMHRSYGVLSAEAQRILGKIV